MPNKQLWAPWRMAYIKGSREQSGSESRPLDLLPGADPDCFLCRAVADDPQRDRENLIAWRGQTALAVLNRYPYNNGHLLISPRHHKARLDALSADEHLEIQQLLARLVGVFERLMNAEGFNIGLNLGRAAGAGVPGHLHWHLVPRWNGDTNFMTVVAGTDVIPQSLDALWEMLKAELK